METLNFYRIEVGRQTKAGNLQTIHEFVVSSTEKNTSRVWEHYRKQYSGFDVKLTTIENIEFHETVEEKKQEVTPRVELKTERVSRLEREINLNVLPSELKTEWGDLDQEFKSFKQKVSKFKESIIANFNSKIKSIGEVSDSEPLTEWLAGNFYYDRLKVRVRLHDDITTTFETLENK